MRNLHFYWTGPSVQCLITVYKNANKTDCHVYSTPLYNCVHPPELNLSVAESIKERLIGSEYFLYFTYPFTFDN
jgi:hypothetical protein